ncbi:uncharacterized protein LOC122498170 [Leptopilina heterotoma]|uniref:uncharacterized protein LOC122498170 n=1 Tax=Leptopilina heterotoma TaxID=63436 RepID=UPI001CAA0802|nr:uncharacterized protein LOC122498170 [Leptopilina heterotoma]XP_043461728.1 uncharacterized protein LOC122498170 [Leptopilina heterotoma]XP_043461729.1 uncharacterized protein LOC122498170 [Leptopilina heterotoma]
MADDKIQSLGLVVRALRKLAENHKPTPKQILNFMAQNYNIPKERIKRQLGSILKRCKEFGILKRTFGHKTPVIDKPACCDCKDCVGNCGYCSKKDKGAMSRGKDKRKMCKGSRRKTMKRQSCKTKSRKSKGSRRSC